MTLEEAEDLTSSTLSDSTQMTLSNVSSQPMSVSMHSEISAVSQTSEAEKHEMEETIECESEMIAEGFDEEMSEPSTVNDNEDEQQTITLDEKCVMEMRDSEKHVRFPEGEESTTDVVYTNEQLTQSMEGVIDSASTITSPGDDVTSSVFAHCAVDEYSRGPPKEKSVEEEKETASMTSSFLTEASSATFDPMMSSKTISEADTNESLTESPSQLIHDTFSESNLQGEVEVELVTPTSDEFDQTTSTPDEIVLFENTAGTETLSPSLESSETSADRQDQVQPEVDVESSDNVSAQHALMAEANLTKHVSFDDGSPDSQTGPKIDFSNFSMEYGNGMHTNAHQALSYTSSLDVLAPSEVQSLHSDEPHDLSPARSELLLTDHEAPVGSSIPAEQSAGSDLAESIVTLGEQKPASYETAHDAEHEIGETADLPNEDNVTQRADIQFNIDPSLPGIDPESQHSPEEIQQSEELVDDQTPANAFQYLEEALQTDDAAEQPAAQVVASSSPDTQLDQIEALVLHESPVTDCQNNISESNNDVPNADEDSHTDHPDDPVAYLPDRFDSNENEIEISQEDLSGPKSELVVESLEASSQTLILTDISVVSKGISNQTKTCDSRLQSINSTYPIKMFL